MFNIQEQEERDYTPTAPWELCRQEAQAAAYDDHYEEAPLFDYHLTRGRYVVTVTDWRLSPYDCWIRCGSKFYAAATTYLEALEIVAHLEKEDGDAAEWGDWETPQNPAIVEPDWATSYPQARTPRRGR